MSDQMPHDDELHALYRKLPPEEPRAEIDAAILAAARARSHEAQRRRFLSRMSVAAPLAAAASVALTIAIARYLPDAGDVRVAGLDEASPRVAVEESADDADMALGEAPAAPHAAPPARQPGAPEAMPAPGGVMAPGGSPAAQIERDSISPDAREALPPHEIERAAPQKKRSADPRARDFTAAGAPPPVDAGIAAGRRADVAQPAAEGDAPASAAKADVPRAKTEAPAPAAKDVPASAAKADPPAAAAEAPAPAANADAPAAAEPEAAPPPALGYLGDAATPEAKEERSTSAAAPEANHAAEGSLAASGAALAKEAPWPFRLEPGLEADETCRRIVASLESACGFRGETAVVEVEPGTKIDAGSFAGVTARRITLHLRGGRLDRVALDLEGYATEQILVAPRR